MAAGTLGPTMTKLDKWASDARDAIGEGYLKVNETFKNIKDKVNSFFNEVGDQTSGDGYTQKSGEVLNSKDSRNMSNVKSEELPGEGFEIDGIVNMAQGPLSHPGKGGVLKEMKSIDEGAAFAIDMADEIGTAKSHYKRVKSSLDRPEINLQADSVVSVVRRPDGSTVTTEVVRKKKKMNREFILLFSIVLLFVMSCVSENNTQYYDNGDVKSRMVRKNDSMSYYTEYYYGGGVMLEGEKLNQNFHGKFNSYYKSGNLEEEIHYVKGERHGRLRLYFENGLLAQNSYYYKNKLLLANSYESSDSLKFVSPIIEQEFLRNDKYSFIFKFPCIDSLIFEFKNETLIGYFKLSETTDSEDIMLDDYTEKKILLDCANEEVRLEFDKLPGFEYKYLKGLSYMKSDPKSKSLRVVELN